MEDQALIAMLFSGADAAPLVPLNGLLHGVYESHLSQSLPDPCGTVGKLVSHIPGTFLHIFISISEIIR